MSIGGHGRRPWTARDQRIVNKILKRQRQRHTPPASPPSPPPPIPWERLYPVPRMGPINRT